MLLPSEGTSFSKPCFSSCMLVEDIGASPTQNCRLCMAEESGNLIAPWAFDGCKVGIGALHQPLLVLLLLLLQQGVKEILGIRHLLEAITAGKV